MKCFSEFNQLPKFGAKVEIFRYNFDVIFRNIRLSNQPKERLEGIIYVNYTWMLVNHV